MKPVIGIVAKPTEKYPEDIWYRMDVVDEIRYLIIQNGGIAINILPTDKTMVFNDNDINDPKELTEEEKNDLYQVVDKCDGIVLQGGLVSCKYEIEVAKRALELNIPMIGICAGFNNILRAIGTDVIEDKTGSHNFYDIDYRHGITIKKDTIMYEIVDKEKMQVNSIHSMIAKKEIIENFVKVSAYSDDGLVESFELSEKKFVLGIKWHPELMMTDGSTQRLFKRFVDECILK